MERRAYDVTDAELAVLEALWRNGRSTIRSLAEELYPDAPGGGATEYATVQKLLERLENKGHVKRERDASPRQFVPVTRRDDLLAHRLRALAEKLCGGSLAPILTHLVHNEKLSPAEIQSLRALLDELGRQRRGGGGGGSSKR
jgi:predicted transcriptional regulator